MSWMVFNKANTSSQMALHVFFVYTAHSLQYSQHSMPFFLRSQLLWIAALCRIHMYNSDRFSLDVAQCYEHFYFNNNKIKQTTERRLCWSRKMACFSCADVRAILQSEQRLKWKSAITACRQWVTVKECNKMSNYVKKTKNRQFSISSWFCVENRSTATIFLRCDSRVPLNMNRWIVKISNPISFELVTLFSKYS